MQPIAKDEVPEQYLKILRNPNLFKIITEFELDKKIVREFEARKVIFLVAQGRLVQNAEKTSYNLLVNASSGAGKDYVAKSTLEIIPSTSLIYRSRISETVFTYWHNAKYEPEWSWDGKVFYNEDISNSVLNCDVFKVMASGGSTATITINQRAIDIFINGKPVMVVTTASANPSPETIRRFPIVNLDESVEQTKEILKRQAQMAKMGIAPNFSNEIIEAQQYLKPVSVKIPYADYLDSYFPEDNIIMRTIFQRFLDYIKASAAFHQYQRKHIFANTISANLQDYTIARDAIIKTASNQYLLPLTKNQQKILEVFRLYQYSDIGEGLGVELKGASGVEKYFTIAELEEQITFISSKTIYEELNKLAELGFLKKTREKIEDKNKPVFLFHLVDVFSFDLPKIKEEIKDFESEWGEAILVFVGGAATLASTALPQFIYKNQGNVIDREITKGKVVENSKIGKNSKNALEKFENINGKVVEMIKKLGVFSYIELERAILAILGWENDKEGQIYDAFIHEKERGAVSEKEKGVYMVAL